mmetsp:Transcript_17248/g.34377  ORF Transcript_17248/g.34377 Transcript_17248/m.34377 type:complete len:274 (-) Transcript_17248:81-902(-)
MRVLRALVVSHPVLASDAIVESPRSGTVPIIADPAIGIGGHVQGNGIAGGTARTVPRPAPLQQLTAAGAAGRRRGEGDVVVKRIGVLIVILVAVGAADFFDVFLGSFFLEFLGIRDVGCRHGGGSFADARTSRGLRVDFGEVGTIIFHDLGRLLRQLTPLFDPLLGIGGNRLSKRRLGGRRWIFVHELVEGVVVEAIVGDVGDGGVEGRSGRFAIEEVGESVGGADAGGEGSGREGFHVVVGAVPGGWVLLVGVPVAHYWRLGLCYKNVKWKD